jgi:hypothetical protein
MARTKDPPAVGALMVMKRNSMRLLAISLIALGVLAGVVTTANPVKASSDIAFDSAPDFLKIPIDRPLGEVAGVATNSRGHVYVFTRTGSATMTIGGSRAFVHGGSRLYEYDQTGGFVREVGKDLYGFMSAYAVRVDADDNIWAVDNGSNMIVKFAPDGRVLMTLGRKAEAVAVPAQMAATNRGIGIPADSFDQPTDVAWDKAGNIFVADGIGNARIVKLSPDGAYITAWGGRGSGKGQLDDIRSLAVDAAGNVYSADRGNKRIQVFDNDGNYQRTIDGIGAPMAICITPGAHQYLYSSNSNSPIDFDNGEIYKLELDGHVRGRFGTAGKRLKEFGSVNEIDCRYSNILVVGELDNWRVQKLILHPD